MIWVMAGLRWSSARCRQVICGRVSRRDYSLPGNCNRFEWGRRLVRRCNGLCAFFILVEHAFW